MLLIASNEKKLDLRGSNSGSFLGHITGNMEVGSP